MEKPNRFQKLVLAAKEKIKEISPNDAARELESGNATLIDVRSGDDWKAGHARDAKHLERGEIELEIEEQIPDLDQPIICYCGGGSRSALVTESLQKMGYRNVRSMKGGFRGWKRRGCRRCKRFPLGGARGRIDPRPTALSAVERKMPRFTL